MLNSNTRIQVSREVAREAARRITQLSDETCSAEFLADCQLWRSYSAEHEEAWCRAARLQQKLGLLPAELSREILQRPDPVAPVNEAIQNTERRRYIAALTALIIAGPAVWLSVSPEARRWSESHWDTLASDFSTGPGQKQQAELPDGTVIVLNTSTSISISYSQQQRLIILHNGEIQITTAQEAVQRPFRVRTSHGLMTALGTRFLVRHLTDESVTTLAVQQGAVAVALPQDEKPQPVQHSLLTEDQWPAGRVAHAGQFTRFNSAEVAEIRSGSAGLDQWQQGVLIADQMLLSELITELSRYRRGWLRCDPDVANLKITGVFQLDNTEHILDSLPQTLPVAVVYRSPYWITVKGLN